MTAEQTPHRTSRRKPWRLRTRLGLVVFLVFLPIAVLVAYSHIESLHDRRQSRLEGLQTVDQSIAQTVDGFARDLESFTLATSTALGSSGAPLTQQSEGAYLAAIGQSYSDLRAVFITDTQGHVLVSANGTDIGLDLSARPYVKALQGGRETIWSGAVAGTLSGQTTMAFGRVIRAPDHTALGYLFDAFYPSQLAATRFPDIPADGNISLIDDTGAVLYTTQDQDHPAPAPPALPNVADSPVFKQAQAGNTVVVKSATSPVDQGKRYGAFVPVAEPGWVVGYTRPVAAIDGPLHDRFYRDLLIVLACLMGGFVAMLIAASRLSQPLSSLARAASAIARGERPVLPTAAADAEVRELEEAMDTMSRAVTEREERLVAQTRVQQLLERVGQAMATELDFENAVNVITQAGLELTGAQAAGVLYRPRSDGQIRLVGVAGLTPSFPLSAEGPLVQATLAGEVINIARLSADPRVARTLYLSPDATEPAESFIGVPVVERSGSVQGGLFLLQTKPGAFGEEEQRLAVGLARRAGAMLENARLYSEARETQEELENANRSKTEFIGMLSHELRTPLTTIYGGARLLHTRRASLSDEDANELIESIEEESERLRRLVENLLVLARADMGEVPAREIVPIGPLVDQTVKQFASRRPSRPVGVGLTLGLPLALAEPTYVRQVLYNLITNADKYSPAGLPIDIQGEQQDGHLELRVLDRGPGVPAEEMEQIFGSFYRSRTTARRAGGEGLGLTVCKRLVEAMSGRIWANAREGGGLEVGFSLPVAQEAEALEAIEAEA